MTLVVGTPDTTDLEGLSVTDALAMFNDATADAGGSTPVISADDPAPAPAAAEEGEKLEKAAPPADKAAEGDSDEGKPIATADGKHVIPYDVLKTARNQLRDTQAALADKDRQIAELSQKLESGTAATTQVAQAATNAGNAGVMLSAEQMAELQDILPDEAFAAIKAQQEALSKLSGTVDSLAAREEQRIADEQSRVIEATQAAIDSVPKLAHWQANESEWFDRAVQEDNYLKTHPAYKDLPLAERFAKAVARVEDAYGAYNLPGSTQPNADAGKATAKQAVDNALSSARKAAPAPSSLSDLPAGAPVAQGEEAALDAMSATQLGNKFASMNPAQLKAYLNTL